ncbi:polysaccharide deacetylase family protein [Bradyrhizobium genosp. L]|uniref:polysaccharide deacetylase family protein n=1 Tax=Bradyrhizobium genosp. L TaxID=83637 RepID=UPI0018A2605B|nr:polysaccharide deacetylase family protein [Bradyrhizobium genosp. L]QPF86546.1 polysaccharide deacetylase family protein [Bradyrhizobium genosp. L]
MTQRKFILNLHGVGTASRAYEPGEQPYWLSQQELDGVLDLVRAKAGGAAIAVTVDDGNSSDYDILAPALRERGISATFFVLAAKLGERGYLTEWQVRALANEGFGIGSHGLDHVDWSRADDTCLARELKESKTILEAVTDRPVIAAAAPFGRYDRRVLRALAKAGYRRVFSSDGGPRLTAAWPTPRLSLQSGVDIGALAGQIDAWSLTDQTRAELRGLLKSSVPGSALRLRRSVRRLVQPRAATSAR